MNGSVFIECDEVGAGFGGDDSRLIQFPSRKVADALQRLLVPGGINQNSPHGLGGGGKEVPASVPLLLAAD